MIKFLTILLTGTVVLGISMCSAQDTQSISHPSIPSITDPDVAETDLLELASGNSAFAFNLYRTIVSNDDGNIFFSPYSISAALAMTYAGAESTTEIEMAEVLQFPLYENHIHSSFNMLDQNLTAAAERDSAFSLHIVNALWGQTGYTFLPEFLEILTANYGAGISLLDFSDNPELCRETINEWVLEQTEGRIEDLIPGGILTTATKLVLTNAIYFKAQWFFQFDEMGTVDQPFHLINGEQVIVPTMHQTEHFPMAKGDGYIAVELPYTNRRVSMLVIVPDENRFPEVEENLENDFIDEVIRSLSDANLYLSIPKFETVSSFQLEDILSSMGMSSAFGMSADFSGMDGTFSLYIASVIHKAFVSVDEKGTEAAAATAVVMQKVNGESSIDFIVDHPFIYLIRDRETGTILFMGRVLNPLN